MLANQTYREKKYLRAFLCNTGFPLQRVSLDMDTLDMDYQRVTLDMDHLFPFFLEKGIP
jgi:hypothetical protein